MKLKKIILGALLSISLIATGCGSDPTPTYTVSIDKQTAELFIGSSGVQLTASVTSNVQSFDNTVTWASENSAVAAVTSTGFVYGVSTGTTNVYAISNADHITKGTCIVTVKEPMVVTFISLSEKIVSLDLNGSSTKTITASVVGSIGVSQEVTWKSDKEDIASVSNGVITGLKVGTASITATSVADPRFSASATVNVVDTTPGALVLNQSTAELDVYTSGKKTVQLKATRDGATPSVSWESSDTSVASVSYSGKVTAVKAGTANIKCTLDDDTSIYAICAVTVTDSTPVVTSVKLSKNSIELDVYTTKTETLTATVEGLNNPSDAVTWKSSNTSVASVSNGVVTALRKGTATITATSNVTKTVSDTCAVTVNDTTPLSVKLDKTSASVSLGKSLQLTATVEHYQTSDEVTWSSNESSVSVSNSGLVSVSSSAVAGTVATITATSKEDTSKSATCTINVVDTPTDKWTVLIYICGADLESGRQYGSLNALASGDISEMLSVSGQPDDVNIVIQTGGAKEWASTHGISASYNQRYHIEKKKLVKDVDKVYTSYQSMGSSSTLKDFIEWGLETYPADKTGLILWNHGGAMSGVCYDEKSSDDPLTNAEVKSAVSGALSAAGVSDKLEFIGYDACLMQVQDVAEFNSQYFNYMIGSEESESGYGWDYDTWLDDLYADKPTETILKAICDGFIQDNGGTSSSQNDQTLSYLNLSKMPEYKNAWENLATALTTKLGSTSKSTFSNWVISNVKKYADEDSYYRYCGTFDAKDFVNKLSSYSSYNPGSEYTSAVLTAHSNLVAYSTCGKGAGNSYGLCMVYACSNSFNGTYNTSNTNFTNWRTFNTKYGYLSSY